MPFFSKWVEYYYNHKTETLHALFLSPFNIKKINTKDKQRLWYSEYKEPKECEDDIYIWYIVWQGNTRIGAVNFAGCVDECETVFFLIPEYCGKGLSSDAYWSAEILVIEKYSVEYIWGEAHNEKSAKVFENNQYNKLFGINDYYKYIEYL